MIDLLIPVLAAAGVGGLAILLLRPFVSGERKVAQRVSAVAGSRDPAQARNRDKERSKDKRRKQLQQVLSQLEEDQKKHKKKLDLQTRLQRAGLNIGKRQFYLLSLGAGAAGAVAAFIITFNVYLALGGAVVGALGFPRWLLNFLRRRREEKFLKDMADAIDIIVRGLRAGLPVSDAMQVIAREMPEPVGPEFLEVVEGQKIGIPIDQGFARMYERVPLKEVNFLAIVIAIQQKTGGNLAEALDNLSGVLRDRKKIKLKIKAMSQEAKSSAAIIGALPFVVMGAISVLNPDYLTPLWTTKLGNIMLIGSGIWMLTGVLVMRWMINMKI
ncbi:MAG TPA: type II secretion system F family protein [Thermopetrobacter sp.]|nr:type II secretion system F family protein [Thermopetrobacter sp.]